MYRVCCVGEQSRKSLYLFVGCVPSFQEILENKLLAPVGAKKIRSISPLNLSVFA